MKYILKFKILCIIYLVIGKWFKGKIVVSGTTDPGSIPGFPALF